MAEKPEDKPAQAAAVEKQQDLNTDEERVVIMYQRSENFDASWVPFRNDPKVHLIEGTTGGAFKWFNPTHARFAQVPDLIGWNQDFDVTDENALPANAEYEWSTRDIRKGRSVFLKVVFSIKLAWLTIRRHALIVRRDEKGSKKFEIPPATATLQGVLKCKKSTLLPF